MIDQQSLKNWLESTNARYSAEQIPYQHRPLRALLDYSRDFKCKFVHDAPIAKLILNWFYERSAPESHAIGSMFTGAFYFDAYFWPLSIPIGYGSFKINPFDCLESMPNVIKENVAKSPEDSAGLLEYWVDCCDYAYGLDDIYKLNSLMPSTLSFIENGSLELSGAINQLVTSRPNPKAILSLRFACEIFMKALLIEEKGLDNTHLKRLGHSIKDIATECYSVSGISEFKIVADLASIFPSVSDRYDGSSRDLFNVWNAVVCTQMAVTTVIRNYSRRDMRSQLLSL